MSTQELFVQQFARLFHHYQEALSPPEGTHEPQPNAWNSVAPEQRNRMVEAARLAILEMETTSRMEDKSRKYFAKPGTAEWGC